MLIALKKHVNVCHVICFSRDGSLNISEDTQSNLVENHITIGPSIKTVDTSSHKTQAKTRKKALQLYTNIYSLFIHVITFSSCMYVKVCKKHMSYCVFLWGWNLVLDQLAPHCIWLLVAPRVYIWAPPSFDRAAWCFSLTVCPLVTSVAGTRRICAEGWGVQAAWPAELQGRKTPFILWREPPQPQASHSTTAVCHESAGSSCQQTSTTPDRYISVAVLSINRMFWDCQGEDEAYKTG